VTYNVVCISATDGSNGEKIGPLVAEGLGFKLVNEEVVAKAAEEAGIQGHVMADLEQRKSVVDRVIHQLLSASVNAPMAVQPPPSPDSLRGVMRSVIEDIASRRHAVIVSHAASHALATRDDALRVLVTAGTDTRRDRIMAADNLSEKEAGKRVARGDTNRADYIKRFYHVSPELPTHYDIVINTDRLSVDEAVDVVVRVASTRMAAAPTTAAPTL
jgi:cytidylate kinase